jgi:hypothetical protein
MAAQGAFAFIKSGCEMLHQGRMELENAKSTVEGVIDDLKGIKAVWQWLVGLFDKKPEINTSEPKVVKKTKKQQSYEELELKLIRDIGDRLGMLFDTQQQINNHYLELEEESKTNFNPEQNTSKKAIERALIELQMEKLMEQTREAMVYAPAELKDLYSRFLKMYAKIEQEQAWARSEMIRRARQARWQKEREEIALIETVAGVVGAVFIFLVLGWIMWQVKTITGRSDLLPLS